MPCTTEPPIDALAGRIVLVTGAAGFIGSHVCERLSALGAHLIALDDLSNGCRSNLGAIPAQAIEFIEGDAADAELMGTLLQRAEAVVHLAALVSVLQSFERPEDGFHRNAVAGFTVLAGAARLQIPVVYASSAAVYGACDQLPLRENASTDPLSPYAADKLYLESTAKAWRAHGLRSIGLRLFNVYGPRQRAESPYSGVIAKFAERLSAHKPCTVFGDGEQSRDYVHVDDVAACICLGLIKLLSTSRDQSYVRVFNCGTGQSFSVNVLHRSMAAIADPAAHVEHASATEGEVRHSLADIGTIRSELGWAPAVALEEGLKKLLSDVGQAR